MNYLKTHKFNKAIMEQLKPLSHSNNYSWLIGIAYDYLVIAVAILASIKISFFLYPLSILLIGSRQRALASLLHDAAHLRLCKNRLLNKLVGTYLAGYPILQGFEAYSKSHVLKHHHFLGDRNNDPDYKYYLHVGLYNKVSKRKFIFSYIVSPLLFVNSFSFLGYLLQNRLLNKNNIRETISLTIFWTILGVIFYFTHLISYLLLFWLIPLLTIFPVIGWFIELAEHYPLVEHAKDVMHASWNRYSNIIEAFFFGIHNESYHLTHHLRPDIPYWNIKKAHNIMLQDLEYALINKHMGGIFLSSNKNTPIIKQMLECNKTIIME